MLLHPHSSVGVLGEGVRFVRSDSKNTLHATRSNVGPGRGPRALRGVSSVQAGRRSGENGGPVVMVTKEKQRSRQPA